jgi:hypothetical protein
MCESHSGTNYLPVRPAFGFCRYYQTKKHVVQWKSYIYFILSFCACLEYISCVISIKLAHFTGNQALERPLTHVNWAVLVCL